MFKLLIILFIIIFYARNDIFKPKNVVIINSVTIECLFRSSAVPLYLGCFPVLLNLTCLLSHVILLLSDQTITFHTKQLSFSLLKY